MSRSTSITLSLSIYNIRSSRLFKTIESEYEDEEFLKYSIVLYITLLQSCCMFHNLKTEEVHLPQTTGWIASEEKAKSQHYSCLKVWFDMTVSNRVICDYTSLVGIWGPRSLYLCLSWIMLLTLLRFCCSNLYN